ncbi:hypothetical protein MAJHIDBO_01828 [Propionibacterium freudenreichii subsp. shermanii]|nr:hypothetical protein MAJHIDBO_01828 [Propionibacterium freudenreichii subsp. shermanii]SPS09617.1 hypothetical protein MAJHIDBO_01828 [Propionibacterium freudenreichii subsp. shermanii]
MTCRALGHLGPGRGQLLPGVQEAAELLLVDGLHLVAQLREGATLDQREHLLMTVLVGVGLPDQRAQTVFGRILAGRRRNRDERSPDDQALIDQPVECRLGGGNGHAVALPD